MPNETNKNRTGDLCPGGVQGGTQVSKDGSDAKLHESGVQGRIPETLGFNLSPQPTPTNFGYGNKT